MLTESATNSESKHPYSSFSTASLHPDTHTVPSSSTSSQSAAAAAELRRTVAEDADRSMAAAEAALSLVSISAAAI